MPYTPPLATVRSHTLFNLHANTITGCRCIRAYFTQYGIRHFLITKPPAEESLRVSECVNWHTS